MWFKRGLNLVCTSQSRLLNYTEREAGEIEGTLYVKKELKAVSSVHL